MNTALVALLLMVGNTPEAATETPETPQVATSSQNSAPAVTAPNAIVVTAKPAVPATTAAKPKEKKVCRAEASVGSRFTRTVCTTVAAKKANDNQNRDEADQALDDAERNGRDSWTPYPTPQ